jgi:hypothetical protein
MCSRKLIGYLGFFHRGVFIGEGAMSEEGPGALTRGPRGQGLATPPLRVGPWWPHSISSSDVWKLPREIRRQDVVSSNSENISCVSL